MSTYNKKNREPKKYSKRLERRLFDYSLRPRIRKPKPSSDSPNEVNPKQDTPQKDSSSESSEGTG